MTALSAVTSLLVRIATHPASRTILNHVIRAATVELIRHVQHHTRIHRGHGLTN